MIQFTSIVKQSDGSWLFSWTTTGASLYRVVLYGQEVTKVSNPSYAWQGQGYELFPPPLEVIDSDSAQSELYQPYLVIQWYGEGADHYDIEKLEGTTWRRVAFLHEVGSWVYTYQTPVLTDERPYQYRVIAVDALGNSSVPRYYQIFIVTPPLSPEGQVAVSYSNPNLTIDAV